MNALLEQVVHIKEQDGKLVGSIRKPCYPHDRVYITPEKVYRISMLRETDNGHFDFEATKL